MRSRICFVLLVAAFAIDLLVNVGAVGAILIGLAAMSILVALLLRHVD